MSKGIYTAVSGAIAQSQKLDTIANNIANVNTPGFKRDAQVFKEYLTSYEKQPTTIEVPRIPASIESFYDMNGGDKSYVDSAGTFTDFSQGSMKATGNPLDIAIEGSGLIEVSTPQGVRFTRSGSFTLDSEGRLVTKQGYPVLKQAATVGEDPASREIRVSSPNITVSYSGEIIDAGQSLGKFSVLNIGNRDGLQKQGNGLFTVRENIDPQLSIAEDYKVQQGFIEASNVNAVREMTDMIATSRLFESTQKAIQAYDQMTGKLINEVPKLG